MSDPFGTFLPPPDAVTIPISSPSVLFPTTSTTTTTTSSTNNNNNNNGDAISSTTDNALTFFDNPFEQMTNIIVSDDLDLDHVFSGSSSLFSQLGGKIDGKAGSKNKKGLTRSKSAASSPTSTSDYDDDTTTNEFDEYDADDFNIDDLLANTQMSDDLLLDGNNNDGTKSGILSRGGNASEIGSIKSHGSLLHQQHNDAMLLSDDDDGDEMYDGISPAIIAMEKELIQQELNNLCMNNNTNTNNGALPTSLEQLIRPPLAPTVGVIKVTSSSAALTSNNGNPADVATGTVVVGTDNDINNTDNVNSATAHHNFKSQQKRKKIVRWANVLVSEKPFLRDDPPAKAGIFAGPPGELPPNGYVGVPMDMGLRGTYEPSIKVNILRTSSSLQQFQHRPLMVNTASYPTHRNSDNRGFDFTQCELGVYDLTINTTIVSRTMRRWDKLIKQVSNIEKEKEENQEEKEKEKIEIENNENKELNLLDFQEKQQNVITGGGSWSGSGIGIGFYRLLSTINDLKHAWYDENCYNLGYVIPKPPHNKFLTFPLHKIRPINDIYLFNPYIFPTIQPYQQQQLQNNHTIDDNDEIKKRLNIYYPYNKQSYQQQILLHPTPRGHCETPVCIIEDRRIIQVIRQYGNNNNNNTLNNNKNNIPIINIYKAHEQFYKQNWYNTPYYKFLNLLHYNFNNSNNNNIEFDIDDDDNDNNEDTMNDNDNSDDDQQQILQPLTDLSIPLYIKQRLQNESLCHRIYNKYYYGNTSNDNNNNNNIECKNIIDLFIFTHLTTNTLQYITTYPPLQTQLLMIEETLQKLILYKSNIFKKNIIKKLNLPISSTYENLSKINNNNNNNMMFINNNNKNKNEQDKKETEKEKEEEFGYNAFIISFGGIIVPPKYTTGTMLATTSSAVTNLNNITSELLQQQQQQKQEYQILDSLNLLSGLSASQQIIKYVTRHNNNNNTNTTTDSHGNVIIDVMNNVGSFLQVDDILSTTSTIKTTNSNNNNSTGFFDMMMNNNTDQDNILKNDSKTNNTNEVVLSQNNPTQTTTTPKQQQPTQPTMSFLTLFTPTPLLSLSSQQQQQTSNNNSLLTPITPRPFQSSTSSTTPKKPGVDTFTMFDTSVNPFDIGDLLVLQSFTPRVTTKVASTSSTTSTTPNQNTTTTPTPTQSTTSNKNNKDQSQQQQQQQQQQNKNNNMLLDADAAAAALSSPQSMMMMGNNNNNNNTNNNGIRLAPPRPTAPPSTQQQQQQPQLAVAPPRPTGFAQAPPRPQPQQQQQPPHGILPPPSAQQPQLAVAPPRPTGFAQAPPRPTSFGIMPPPSAQQQQHQGPPPGTAIINGNNNNNNNPSSSTAFPNQGPQKRYITHEEQYPRQPPLAPGLYPPPGQPQPPPRY